jgi:anti-sigma B factor antagonist
VSSSRQSAEGTPEAVGVLRVGRTSEGAVTTLTFTGDLDIATLVEAEDAVAAAERDAPDVLVVDLSGLEFLDSSGVRLVLQAEARARTAGRRLAVVLGTGRALRLFEVLGLLSRLDVVESPDGVGGA